MRVPDRPHRYTQAEILFYAVTQYQKKLKDQNTVWAENIQKAKDDLLMPMMRSAEE